MGERLQLVATECGLARLAPISRTRRAELFRAEATDAPCSGARRMLKLIRGPRPYLLAHDRVLDRVMASQVMGSLACARTPHPRGGGILPVLAHGRYSFADGEELVYQVSPWIEGSTLQECIGGARFSFAVSDRVVDGDPLPSLSVAITIVDAVIAMAEAVPGHVLVHRDLRPSNIILSSSSAFGAGGAKAASGAGAARQADPVPIIIDLDTAVLLDGPGRVARRPASTDLSAAAMAPGTPAYTSPEEVVEGFPALSDRSDVFSLGVILHQVLTGRWPYPFTPLEAADQAFWSAWLKDGGGATVDAGLPAELGALLEACLAIDPARRPSLREVARHMRELEQAMRDVAC